MIYAELGRQLLLHFFFASRVIALHAYAIIIGLSHHQADTTSPVVDVGYARLQSSFDLATGNTRFLG